MSKYVYMQMNRRRFIFCMMNTRFDVLVPRRIK